MRMIVPFLLLLPLFGCGVETVGVAATTAKLQADQAKQGKEDIDKAVKDAEQYAAEDKKRREEVDVRNNADQMVFQTEKALGELGDKVSPSEKSECEAKLNALKEALKGTDIEAIKAKQDDLQKAFYAISEKVYQQAAQQQGQQPGADAQQGPTGNAGSAPKDDGAVDADFHEV